MNKQTKRAFVLSSMVHGIGLAGIGIAGLLAKCSDDEPEAHVFTLVASPPPASIAPPPTPKPKPTVRKPPPPKPRPTVRKPTPPKPKPTVRKPTPKPKPTVRKPDPPLRKTTLDQFNREHPKTSRPTPKPTPLPRFDPTTFAVNVKVPPITIKEPVTTGDPGIRDRYLAKVRQKIEREWRRLNASANLSSPGAGIVQVQVEFRIGASGDLRSSRLARKSSYAEFDRLVLRAVRGIGNVGRPPVPINSSLSMNFSLN